MPRINLADPSFEPTDGQLADLSRDAFGDLQVRSEKLAQQVRAKVRAQILEKTQR